MDNRIKDSLDVFKALSKQAHNYLIDTLGYSPKVATSYQRAWRRIFVQDKLIPPAHRLNPIMLLCY